MKVILVKKSYWLMIFSVLLGFFWSYSFSTRIGLFFVVPLWLKIFVIGALTANFALIGWYGIGQMTRKASKKTNWVWILGGAILVSALVFLLAPYQRVPFRTTHHMTISALDDDVKIIAIYSPDDNVISREVFEIEGEVEPYAKHGFSMPPGSQINYVRAHTGKLTLSFAKDSGPAFINWDGVEQTVQPSEVRDIGRIKRDGWRIAYDADLSQVRVELPGNTWGQPDLFWGAIGVLLPISDFITLTTIVAALAGVVIEIKGGFSLNTYDKRLIRFWLDALISLGLVMILINVGFPDFIPWWFLLTTLPAVAVLFYRQLRDLVHLGLIRSEKFLRIDQAWLGFKKSVSAWNRDQRLLWVLISMTALLGCITQLNITEPGMIISGDSIHYLNGAENLASGRGYVLTITQGDPAPITGFEPGYSLSLVPGILIGGETPQVARFSNMLMFFAVLMLTGWIMFTASGKILPALMGNLFLVMSPVMISIFSFVMSEALFIPLLLGAILAWFYQVKKPSIWKAILAGLIFTLMLNARLAGIVILPVFAICMLVFQKNRFIQRVRDVFVFGLNALVAPAVFTIRNQWVTDTSPQGQGLMMTPFLPEYWEALGGEVSRWFQWHTYFNLDHQRFNAVFVTLSVILLLFLFWFAFRKKLAMQMGSDPIIILIFFSMLVYFSSIIINAILAVQTPTEGGLIRYMIPLLILMVILISKLFSFYWKQPFIFQKIVIVFILLVGLQLYYGEYVGMLREQPIAYRHYTDRKNECGDAVNELISTLPDVAFYTNNCEYFYFMTGERCLNLAFNQAAYQPSGEIHQAMQSGAMIAFSEGFGSNPIGIEVFLGDLTRIDTVCYLSFYRWP